MKQIITPHHQLLKHTESTPVSSYLTLHYCNPVQKLRDEHVLLSNLSSQRFDLHKFKKISILKTLYNLQGKQKWKIQFTANLTRVVI